MRTVVDALMAAAGTGGRLTTITDDGARDRGWDAVHRQARQVAAVLLADGIGRGHRVGLLADTGIELVVALQGCWLAGAAVTVLPLPARPDQLLAVVADAGLDLVLHDDPVHDGPAHDGPGHDGPGHGRVLAGATRVLPLTELLARAASAAPAAPARPEPTDLAVLQYTSGSTRSPRGVPVTHGHLAAHLDGLRAALQHAEYHPGPVLSWLPLYHDLGLIAFLALPMSCGCSTVLCSPTTFQRRPAVWLEAITRYRPAVSGAPNFAYGLLTRLLRGVPAVDLGSLRRFIAGGEPIDAATMAAFLDAARPYGLDPSAITAGYGLAEATLAVTVTRPGTGLRVDAVDPRALETRGHAVPARGGRPLVRVGPPVPGLAVRVVDRRSGAELGPRLVGRIEVRGPSVVGHYWGAPPPAPDTWLDTGDLGYLVDGELVVCGRVKDVLFAAGRNVFPQDVEAAATAVAGVRAGGAVAFGVPAGGTGDRLVLAVESRAADPSTVAGAVTGAVVGAVLAEVGLRPADVVVLAPHELPRTSSGKVRRAETRRRYLAGELGRSRTRSEERQPT